MIKRKNWKYNEEEVVENFMDYLNNTYSQHYTNDENDIQCLDIWKARGTMTDTSIDNAIKYLIRYGKKEGRNIKDLYKAMHYVVLAIGNDEMESEIEKEKRVIFEDVIKKWDDKWENGTNDKAREGGNEK